MNLTLPSLLSVHQTWAPEHYLTWPVQGSKLTFLLGSTGAPNFKKLGAPQMF